MTPEPPVSDPTMSEQSTLPHDDDNAVAIVGMAGRFPGAPDLSTFWDTVRTGSVGIRTFDRDELRAAGVPDVLADSPTYVPARGVLDDAEYFDPAPFGMSPADAELADPQFRNFFECSFAALEDAGIVGGGEVPIGVFGGVGAGAYMLHLLRDPALHGSLSFFRALINNEKDYLATQTSYALDLRGPSFTVQSACSTGLVAVHLATQSLLAGECDVALAGASSISFPQHYGYLYEHDGFLSPDGRCRPFDAQGRGTVEGNGVGVVVLKRLEDALAERDTIRAVLRGTAVNNDGACRVGFTAPGVEGQVRVLTEALSVANVDPRDVDFIETHGTATRLGDPIELSALARVYGDPSRAPLYLGAVKANIGHLGPAAGLAGLLKTTLALQHATIPPTPGFSRPNPEADFAAGPFEVPTTAVPWPEHNAPRRAGVSAFGIGGTNAHVIVEQAPRVEPTPTTPGPHLLTWSALDEQRADLVAERLAAHLEGHSELPLADVAHTLRVGRRAFPHRRAVVVRDLDGTTEALRTPRRVRRAHAAERPRIAFIFAGLGDQYPGMARALDRTYPVFRSAFDRCARGFAEHLGVDLRSAVLEVQAAPSGKLDLRRMLGRGSESDAPALRDTRLAQPAVFCVGYALAQLLMSWGLHPDAVIGHSLGEYIAAHIAGVLNLDDTITLVAERARALDALEPGAMLTVARGEAELRPYLDELGISLSAVNAPEACTVAGTPQSIATLQARLEAEDIAVRLLPATRAFHSFMMEPAVPDLVRRVASLERRAPTIPCVSNVSGRWLGDEEALEPEYWGRHLRQPVRFADGIATLCEGEPPLLIELGASGSLGSFVHQAQVETRGIVSTLCASYEPDDGGRVLEALATAWLHGAEVDWSALPSAGRRVPLPAYPFARTRYVRRIDAPLSLGRGPAAPSDSGPSGENPSEFDASPSPPPAGAPEGAPPTTPVEEALVDLWRELLRLPNIGIHDGFFEFGGQSLVGVQLLSRIQQTWGVELSLRTLFTNPTIAELALSIEEALLAEIEAESESDTDEPDAVDLPGDKP